MALFHSGPKLVTCTKCRLLRITVSITSHQAVGHGEKSTGVALIELCMVHLTFYNYVAKKCIMLAEEYICTPLYTTDLQTSYQLCNCAKECSSI